MQGVLSHPRARTRRDGRRVHVVNYRHVIHALKRKPRALAGSVYRDSLLPRSEYAQAWQLSTAQMSQKAACRRMVGLLALAHEEACEAALASVIADDLAAGRLPHPAPLRHKVTRQLRELPDVSIELTTLASFDSLLKPQP